METGYCKCIDCKTLFEFKYEDLPISGQDEDRNEFRNMNCPECGTLYSFSASMGFAKDVGMANDIAIEILKNQLAMMTQEVKDSTYYRRANSVLYDQIKELKTASIKIKRKQYKKARDIIDEQVEYLERTLNKSYKDSVGIESDREEETENGKHPSK